jgi:hypothetical protein
MARKPHVRSWGRLGSISLARWGGIRRRRKRSGLRKSVSSVSPPSAMVRDGSRDHRSGHAGGHRQHSAIRYPCGLAAASCSRWPAQPLGINLGFYRSKSGWLEGATVTILPFDDYVTGPREVVDRFGGNGALVEIPPFNSAAGPVPVPSMSGAELVRANYKEDLPL